MLQPMTPLHEFIEKLGRPPDRDALTIYIARLREMVRAPAIVLCTGKTVNPHCMPWPLSTTDSSGCLCQGFTITEKLRKVMESGAELLPEVRCTCSDGTAGRP